MENWTRTAAEIAAALSDVGHTAILLRKGVPTGPEWDQTPGEDRRIPVTLLGDTLAIGLIDGTAIKAGDRREMMAAEGTAPEPSDRLLIGSTTYAIVRAEPFAPGGVPVYFDLILRA